MDVTSELYQRWLKPFLFRKDPEEIHHKTLSTLALIGRSPTLCDLLTTVVGVPPLPTEVSGLQFPNPIGLAAGMDKNGLAIPAWAALGLGFCEIGGVTQYPQPGNPKPRLFRSPKTEAIINRMGFNNHGADAIHSTLTKSIGRNAIPLGINLGKSKRTPLEEAHIDFAYSFEKLWSVGDFFVVNVSSPNTPGLRELQDKDSLRTILKTLVDSNSRMAAKQAQNSPAKPLFVKIAPDLSLTAIDDVIDLTLNFDLDGIVATNTTISRPESPGTTSPLVYQQVGGLSGKPLRQKSTEIIRHISNQTQGKLKLIGVGGIDSAESAWEKITSGANLCQVYSGLVYHGPGMIHSIVKGISEQMELHGFSSFKQAVGSRSPYIKSAD